MRSQTNIPADAVPKFYPIFGKVVVKIDDAPERMYGKLHLPQRDRERSTIGKIHAVYAAEETLEGRIEPQVKVGDTVLFGQYTGTTIAIGRDLFIICKEHDLLCVLDFEPSLPIEEVL